MARATLKLKYEKIKLADFRSFHILFLAFTKTGIKWNYELELSQYTTNKKVEDLVMFSLQYF